MNVYITNAAGHDYERAKEYGDLVYVTQGYVSFHSLDRLKYIISEKLRESKPNEHLLLSGTQVICVVAAIVWYEKHGSVNLLVHDKKNNNSYRKLTITQTNLTEIFRMINDGVTT